MGLAPCLVVTLLAVHHVAGLGAPRPVSSLDAKQQEIVDFAVVQLQVSCPVKDIYENTIRYSFQGGEHGPCRRKPRMEKFSQQVWSIG